MKAALQNYQARMRRVLDHIDRHLDGDLDLETVSGVAAFSKFHFHRQFTATFGLSVHRYVQLARMKRASHQLAYMDAQSVTDIAMDAGYDAPDAFARAFRQRFGQSPSSFRKSPDWEPWLAAFGPLDNARSKLMQKTFTFDDVTLPVVQPTKVAIMEHRDDPACAPPQGGDDEEARGPGNASRHDLALHRVAQGGEPAPQDKSDLHGLALRAASCLADRVQHGPLRRDRPADRGERRRDQGRRDPRRTLRGAARRRLHRQSRAGRALPLSRLASRQRRRSARLPDLLPAAEPVPGGAGARDGRGRFLAAEVASADGGLSLRSRKPAGRHSRINTATR